MRRGPGVVARPAAVAALAFALAACSPIAPPGGDWLNGPTRPALFAGIQATVLVDGRVLVTSWGSQPATAAPAALAQVFDPGANRWQPAADFPAGWLPGPGVLLHDGSVLVTPGQDGEAPLRYLPGSDRWVSAGRMAVATRSDTATPLPDGRVLVIGGSGFGAANPLQAAQLYDPATGSWSLTPPMADPRFGAAAVLLRDRSVLVIGGTDLSQNPVNSVERDDPGRNTWSAAAGELVPSFLPRAVRLPDGRVLVVNVFDPFGGDSPYNQVYDPRANTWQFGPPQPSPQGGPLVSLADGRVLMVKTALNQVNPLFRGEILDPTTMTWSATRSLQGEPGALVRLRDGRVLAIGPQADWIFDPNAIPPPESGRQGLGSPQLTLLLGAVAALLAILVLAQFLVARAADRRPLKPVS